MEPEGLAELSFTDRMAAKREALRIPEFTELILLQDLVGAVSLKHGISELDALLAVCSELTDGPLTSWPVFECKPGAKPSRKSATTLDADDVELFKSAEKSWTLPAAARRDGSSRSFALGNLKVWTDERLMRPPYSPGEAMQMRPLALMRAEALEYFGLIEPATTGSVGGVDMGKIVSPEGGSWPHKKGDTWTDAERVAMFKMRHLHKLTGEQIASVAGVTRQLVDQQIGAVKAAEYGTDTWQPSAELLNACGIALQPLHSVANALQ